jgi:hypothetical protein
MLIDIASLSTDFHEFSGICNASRKTKTSKMSRVTYQTTRGKKFWSMALHYRPICTSFPEILTNFPEFPLPAGKLRHSNVTYQTTRGGKCWSMALRFCPISTKFPLTWFEWHIKRLEVESADINAASLLTNFHQFSGISNTSRRTRIQSASSDKRLVMKNSDRWRFVFDLFNKFFGISTTSWKTISHPSASSDISNDS